MDSIILELRAEIMSPDCDVVNVLRRAHVIAVKLGLKEFDQWISCELNGYPSAEPCPDYRTVRGVLKANNPYRGLIPVRFTDPELERALSKTTIPKSISEIVSLCKITSDFLLSELSVEQLNFLRRNCNSFSSAEYPISLILPKTSLMEIVEKVKNTILEWTLKLEEKGILGENLKFSETEKKSAKEMSQNVNFYYGPTNVINAPSEGMQIVSGNESVSFSYNEVSLALTDIENAINDDKLEPDDRKRALELLSDIRNMIKTKERPSIIRTSLDGLRQFLLDVSAQLAANLILSKIQGLF